MKVKIIRGSLSPSKVREKLDEICQNKKRCNVYSITDLTHRSQHIASDIYVIDRVQTQEVIKMILTIDMWMPSFQKDIVVITYDDMDKLSPLQHKIKDIELFIL